SEGCSLTVSALWSGASTVSTNTSRPLPRVPPPMRPAGAPRNGGWEVGTAAIVDAGGGCAPRRDGCRAAFFFWAPPSVGIVTARAATDTTPNSLTAFIVRPPEPAPGDPPGRGRSLDRPLLYSLSP